MSAHYRPLDYKTHIIEAQLATFEYHAVVAAQDIRYILYQFEEFLLHVTSRFG